VLCAAGLRDPAIEAAAAFTETTGIAIRFQFGGSGQLLGSLVAGAPADVFLAADASYLRIGHEKGLIAERVALATQRPVIAVPAGNPRGVRGLGDLARLRYGLPNPESASLGRTLQARLGVGWGRLAAGAAVTKPTVTDLVADLQLGALDAALLWDANVSRLAGFEAVAAAELAGMDEAVSAGVVSASRQREAALALLRWLASTERGAPIWRRAGYGAAEADAALEAGR
jgi:molybdate transport system substrate-binding protein